MILKNPKGCITQYQELTLLGKRVWFDAHCYYVDVITSEITISEHWVQGEFYIH